jgi:hypothetical protein
VGIDLSFITNVRGVRARAGLAARADHEPAAAEARKHNADRGDTVHSPIALCVTSFHPMHNQMLQAVVNEAREAATSVVRDQVTLESASQLAMLATDGRGSRSMTDTAIVVSSAVQAEMAYLQGFNPDPSQLPDEVMRRFGSDSADPFVKVAELASSKFNKLSKNLFMGSVEFIYALILVCRSI